MQSTVFTRDDEARLAGISVDATRVGPFLFLSSQTGVDPATGKFVSKAEDLPSDERARIEAHHYVGELEWPMAAQTWAVYANLRRVLARYGATLENLVRTETFFRDLGEFPAMERVRAMLLGGTPPASTVLAMTDRGLHPDVRLMVDGVAVLPDPGYPQIVKAPVSPSLRPGAHYAIGLCTGQLIWPSGQPGNHPVTGEVVRGLADLPPEAQWLVTGNRHLDIREGRVLAQVWRAYDNLRLILEAAGSTLHDLVKETICVRDIRYLSAVEQVRRQLFPTPESAPAASVVEVVDLARSDNQFIAIDAVGLVPKEHGWRREAVLAADGARPRLWGPVAVKAGPLIFTSGAVGLGKTGEPVRSLREVAGSGRPLQLGRPYRDLAAVGQTEQALATLADVLHGAGSSLERTVHLSVYADDFGQLPEIERVLGARFGDRPPAARSLALPRVDAHADCRVKIEAVALAS